MPSEEALRSMQKYLLLGAQMMTDSCPTCGIPLLKDKKTDKVFCAHCKREVKYVKDADEAKEISDTQMIKTSFNQTISDLEAVIIGKINAISLELASTNDLNVINRLLEVILQSLDVIGKIRLLKKK